MSNDAEQFIEAVTEKFNQASDAIEQLRADLERVTRERDTAEAYIHSVGIALHLPNTHNLKLDILDSIRQAEADLSEALELLNEYGAYTSEPYIARVPIELAERVARLRERCKK